MKKKWRAALALLCIMVMMQGLVAAAAVNREAAMEPLSVQEEAVQEKAVSFTSEVYSWSQQVSDKARTETFYFHLGNNGTEAIDLNEYVFKVKGTEGIVFGDTKADETYLAPREDLGESYYLKGTRVSTSVTIPADCKLPVIKYAVEIYDKKDLNTPVYTTGETLIYPFTTSNGVLSYNDTAKGSKYELKIECGEHVKSADIVWGSTTGDPTEVYDGGERAGLYLRPGHRDDFLAELEEGYSLGVPTLIPADAGTVTKVPGTPLYGVDLHAPATIRFTASTKCVLEGAFGIQFTADAAENNEHEFMALEVNSKECTDESVLSFVRENIEPLGEIKAYEVGVGVSKTLPSDMKAKLEGNTYFRVPIPEGWNSEEMGFFRVIDNEIYDGGTLDISEDGKYAEIYAPGFHEEFQEVTSVFGIFKKSAATESRLWKNVVSDYVEYTRFVDFMNQTTLQDHFFEENAPANDIALITRYLGKGYEEYRDPASGNIYIPYDVLVRDAGKYYKNVPDLKNVKVNDIFEYDAAKNAFVIYQGGVGDAPLVKEVVRTEELGNGIYAIRFKVSKKTVEDAPDMSDPADYTECTLVVEDNGAGDWRYLSFVEGYPEITPEEPEQPVEPEQPEKPEEPEKPSADTTLINPDNGKTLSNDFTWKVKTALEEAGTGSKVTVEMNKATEVPKAVLEAVAGKDVDLVLDMGAYSWKINGKNVTADELQAIDLGVAVNVNVIPKEVVDAVADGKENMQISLAHDGAFGFKAELSLDMGRKNAGKEVVLYYYNEETGKLEKVQTRIVGRDGIAVFTFEHASDYVAVINDKKADKDDAKVPQTGDRSNISLYMMMLIISGAAVVMTVRRKRA